MTRTERATIAGGLGLGTALGLLLGAAFVGVTGDWSWLAFTLTLGWALGLGIGMHRLRAGNRASAPKGPPSAP